MAMAGSWAGLGRSRWPASLLALVLLLSAAPGVRAELFLVNREQGESHMTAVFDFTPLGERIVAESSQVDCRLDLDETGTAAGRCRVPLRSISVDGEPTKTGHFYQWTTNKKVSPLRCDFELTLEGARVLGAVTSGAPLAFSAKGHFTVCGRGRSDGAAEAISGMVTILPPDAQAPVRRVRIEARIEDFDREAYRIGPQFTDGWVSRIPKIEKLVASTGTIEIDLVAYPWKGPTAGAEGWGDTR